MEKSNRNNNDDIFYDFPRYEAIIMMCSYSFYLILMYFNPSIEKFVYRITNTAQNPHHPEHHLGYTGLAPARDDGTDELCTGHHKEKSHEENQGGVEEDASETCEDDATNGIAILMINNDEVEIKTDASIGTPDNGQSSMKMFFFYKIFHTSVQLNISQLASEIVVF